MPCAAVAASPSSSQPQPTPNKGIKNVTVAAFTGPTSASRRKYSTYANEVHSSPSASIAAHTAGPALSHTGGTLAASQAANGASASTAPHWLPSATMRLSSPPRRVIQLRVKNPARP